MARARTASRSWIMSLSPSMNYFFGGATTALRDAAIQALEQARRYFSRRPAAYIEENLSEIRDELWRLFNAHEADLTCRLSRALLDCHEISDGSLCYLAAVSTHLTPSAD